MYFHLLIKAIYWLGQMFNKKNIAWYTYLFAGARRYDPLVSNFLADNNCGLFWYSAKLTFFFEFCFPSYVVCKTANISASAENIKYKKKS